MRILLVSHAPLSAELGASQAALNLAAALRACGHEALAWSPEPLPAGAGRWNRWRHQRQALERFAAEQGPFDVIDTPATTAGRDLDRRGKLIVRSIQPELGYLWQEMRTDLVRRPPALRSLAHALIATPRAAAILAGWRRASFILCLGSLELFRMIRRFPRWRPKLGSYVIAPSSSERTALIEIRQRRRTRSTGDAIRFLWIGRWAAHKGVGRLTAWIGERVAGSPGDTFTLAGCGQDAERDLRPEWLRSGQVRLVPSFSRTELPTLLASHDAGLFTSTVEGWGLSLNEMLESGMPVFATEAGAVMDLRPFFPESLRPFPPPARVEPSFAQEDLEDNGYFAKFNWDAIAKSYEAAVLSPRLHAG